MLNLFQPKIVLAHIILYNWPMEKSLFNFCLPTELIANYPAVERSQSRLLVHKHNEIYHDIFSNLEKYLKPHDLLIFNNTKVLPARFFGNKLSGGKVEFLLERTLTPQDFLSHIKTSKTLKPGTIINLPQNFRVEIMAKVQDLYHVKVLSDENLEYILNKIGHIPLPVYIKREDEDLDKERYQTVYAKHNGSVAAPTAGLHFDDAVFASLAQKNIDCAYLTLHVSAGTFKPVTCSNIADHHMHEEFFFIPTEVADKILTAKDKGGRIIAVGTTSLRSLESAAIGKYQIQIVNNRSTKIFITPGYDFKICDGLITNFHTPESTLIMLVSAFIGYEKTMALYQEAIEKRYRFYSYGDSSLLWR
jgi:S-adenosylmethionine:tRNA ribosyltransferase-isomerase